MEPTRTLHKRGEKKGGEIFSGFITYVDENK
jgi:hypothetical protein